MGQPVAYFEVISANPQRAQQFYSELFGWQLSVNSALNGYGSVDTGGVSEAIGGGIGSPWNPGGVGVRLYIRVPDLGVALDEAERLGGKRLVEPAQLPGGHGRYAMFADPDGNPVGLWD